MQYLGATNHLLEKPSNVAIFFIIPEEGRRK